MWFSKRLLIFEIEKISISGKLALVFWAKFISLKGKRAPATGVMGFVFCIAKCKKFLFCKYTINIEFFIHSASRCIV